jgi:hypothetical protein
MPRDARKTRSSPAESYFRAPQVPPTAYSYGRSYPAWQPNGSPPECRVLLCIAHDPGVRLRDIAAGLGITERSAYGIVTDLTAVGYVAKQKDGRRNRYQIQAHLPLPEPASQEPAIGDVLALHAGAGARLQPTGTGPA